MVKLEPKSIVPMFCKPTIGKLLITNHLYSERYLALIRDPLIWAMVNPKEGDVPGRPTVDHSSRSEYGNFLSTKLDGEDKGKE